MMPGTYLLLVDDLLDATEHAVTERQPRIDPRARLRTIPARSISLWLTICASAGFSLRMGRKYRDIFIARFPLSVLARTSVNGANDRRRNGETGKLADCHTGIHRTRQIWPFRSPIIQ